MKHLVYVLLFVSLVACVPNRNQGGGNAGYSGSIVPFTLPQQWTSTYTREPTLHEPTRTDTPEPTATLTPEPTRTKLPTLTPVPSATYYSGPMGFEKIRTLSAGEAIVGIDYQPTMQWLVSISATGNIRMYDTAQGARILDSKINSSGPASILLDPDGAFFIVGVQDRIEIRNAQTASSIHLLQENFLHIRGIALSAGKRVLGVTDEKGFYLISKITGEASVVPTAAPYLSGLKPITRPVFSPDEMELAYGGIWEGSQTLSINYLEPCSEGLCVNGGEGGNAFAPYGAIVDLQISNEDWLAVASGNYVAVFDPSRTKEWAHAEVTNLVNLALAEDDHLLVASTADGKLVLMRFPSLETVASIQAHQGKINQLVYSAADGVIATAGEDGLIDLWKIVRL